MNCLKGVVTEMLKGFAKIELETGEHFWTIATPTMAAKDRIIVGWDFTHNQPSFIQTKYDKLDIEEPEISEDIILPNDGCDKVVDKEIADVFSTTDQTDVSEVFDV